MNLNLVSHALKTNISLAKFFFIQYVDIFILKENLFDLNK